MQVFSFLQREKDAENPSIYGKLEEENKKKWAINE